jgi:tetratricopeptide (TPR) repeat protein
METRAAAREQATSLRDDALVFLSIAAVAFALRFVHLLQARAVPLFDALLMDGQSYSAWADTIVAGHWLGDRTFYQAPLYPYFLAVVKLTVGNDLWRIRLVQIAIGSISCGVLFLAGRSFFSRRAGIAAGVLLAFYPPAIFFDGLIQKANLGLLWTVLLLWLLALAKRFPTPVRFSLAGVSLGLLMLTREETILLAPVIAIWAWISFHEHPVPSRSRWIAAYVAGLALVLLPVGLRNLKVGGELVLTTSQAGPNFYIGNNLTATGTYVPLRPGRQNTVFERQDAVDLAEQALGRKLTPREVSSYWRGRAFAFIRSEPLAWTRLMLRKVALLLNWYELPDYEDMYFYERGCGLLRALDAVWHFGILLPLGLAGIALSWRRRRELSILHALLATIGFGVVLFYVFARYRYPLVPILALFAGAALVEASEAARARKHATLVVPALVLLVSGAISNLPLFRKDFQLAESLNNAASVLAGKHDDARAVEMLEQSLQVKPDVPETLGNLGLSWMRLGRVDEAIATFRRASELRPGDARALLRLGAALEQVGKIDEATAAIARALQIDRKGVLESAILMVRQTHAHDLVALDILAAAQAGGGSFDAAVATASQALEIQPPPGQAALAAKIRERLELYRHGKTDRP